MAGLVDFQDEEQVKSFLENLKVECNYQCYQEKDPEGERPGRPGSTWEIKEEGAGAGGVK